jgi:hypothetical protein
LPNQPWAQIVTFFGEIRRRVGDGEFASALAGVEGVATLIAEAPANYGLFGWTSMHDLCIQQTDGAPGAGPYLRISPQKGSVEFRFVDTAIASRQWIRRVPAEKARERFVQFLDQLHWVG